MIGLNSDYFFKIVSTLITAFPFTYYLSKKKLGKSLKITKLTLVWPSIIVLRIEYSISMFVSGIRYGCKFSISVLILSLSAREFD